MPCRLKVPPVLGCKWSLLKQMLLWVDKLPGACLPVLEKEHLPAAMQKSWGWLNSISVCFQIWASAMCEGSCVFPKHFRAIRLQGDKSSQPDWFLPYSDPASGTCCVLAPASAEMLPHFLTQPFFLTPGARKESMSLSHPFPASFHRKLISRSLNMFL